MFESGRTGQCMYCEQEFYLSKARRLFCSDKCKIRFGRENTSCFYCGEVGQSRDHVIPHSLTENAGSERQWSVDWVHCCMECNSLLGNYLGRSFYDRILYLHDKFKRKKKLNKAHVEWDEEELKEMSSSMRKWIVSEQNKRKIDERRLNHIRLTSLKVAKFEEEQKEYEDEE